MKKTDNMPSSEPGIVFDDDLDFVVEDDASSVGDNLQNKTQNKTQAKAKQEDSGEINFSIEGEVLEPEPISNSKELDVISTGLAEKASGGRIGDQLIEKGLITPDQLNVALQEKKQSSKMMGEILVDLGFIEADTLLSLIHISEPTRPY